MKKIFYFSAALAVLAGVASCEKSSETTQPQQPGGYRQVTISAAYAQTKTSVSGGALTWSANDKLNIVPQSGTVAAAALSIKTGVGTATGTFEGQIDASITDVTELYGWCGGDWTYNSGTFSVNMPTEQTYVANGLAENAYPSIGTGSITSGITLSNPMGVLKLTIKGASSDLVKSISLTSSANNLAGSFTVTPGTTSTVSGGSSKTLTLNVADPYVALSATGATFYVVVPPAEYAASDLTVKITFSDDLYLNTTLTDAVTVAANNATAKEITVSEDKTGRHGILNNQEYVLIKAKYNGTDDSYLKWATQNLAVTESGKGKWNGTDYVIGDYFLWATYDGYVTGTKPENLVVYTSFTNTFTSSGNSFSGWKDSKSFNKNCAPYYKSAAYTKYTSNDSKITLEQTDDVANIVLGGTWRMPTGGNAGEIKAMREVTYWASDATDKGYYVFNPGVGTSGAPGGNGSIGTDDKTKALLFFPAAGYAYNTALYDAGVSAGYWSGTLYTNDKDSACSLFFSKSGIIPSYTIGRYNGFAIRPVSN